MEIFSSLQTFPLSMLSCMLLVTFICMKWINSYNSKNKKNIPPSPRKLPIIGNLHQLGSSPNHNLQIMSQKYGPLMLLRLGSIPTLVASTAEAVQEIMKTHDLSFSSRPSMIAPNILFYGSKDIAFSPYGEYWRKLKSLVVLKLLSNIRVKSYKNVRESEIAHTIKVLGESYGTTIHMGLMFKTITSNVISRIALGRKVDEKMFNLFADYTKMFNVFYFGSYFPWLSWVDHVVGTIGKAERIAKVFDEFLEVVIEEHVNKNDAKSNEGEDFVDILLDLQKDDTSGFTLERDTIKALILEAFAAGTDTTHHSLEWTMSELIKNPNIMQKLQQEVTEIGQGRSMIYEEDLERMPYLKAVVKESLRFHTPFPLLIPRESVEDVKVMGYDIPAGTQVILNAWAIGRDPTSWEEPNEFKPERFLNNTINYQGWSFDWIPFGGGRRICPCIQFSARLMELVLANIVYKFDISLPNGVKNEDLDMTEAFGNVIHRKSPLLVCVSPRF